MKRQEWLNLVKQAVVGIEPSAKVILSGSRARGTAHRESDWDLMILVPDTLDREQERLIRQRLYELEWATGEVISCVIRGWHDWEKQLLAGFPFYKQVAQEGIWLE